MATVNLQALQIAIERPLEKACRQAATELAQEKFDEAKEKFLTDFLADPVSQEIEEGPDSEGGLLAVPGNLFSFIGFDIEDNPSPIEDLYNFLDKNISMVKTPSYNSSIRQYSFQVRVPSKDDIKDVTPMPWGTARSWVFAIESGISGLNQYLSRQRLEEIRKKPVKEMGRSTGGIQLKGALTNGVQFRAKQYMSSLLNSFAKDIQS